MGAERKSFYIDDKVKLMTAYHEVSRPLGLLNNREITRLIFYITVIGRSRVGRFVYRWCYAPAQGNLRSSWTRVGRCEFFVFSDLE